MATAIDELVVEIGLDPKNFAAGRAALTDEMDRAKQAMASLGRDIEGSGQRISDVFSFLKRGVVGLVATFVGGEAAAFIDQIANMDAHTMRLARSIGESTHELSVWQNMIKSVGGNAEDVSSAFAGLNDAFMGMRMGNQMPAAPFASLLSRAGVDWRNANESGALEQIMKFLQPQSPQDQRFWLKQIPGMNNSMILLLMEMMRNPEKMRHLREEIERLGVASDASGEAAADLQAKTTELETAWQSLARVLFPFLTFLTSKAAELLSLPGIGKVLGGAAAGALAGSVIPGVGTVGGALIGGAAGAIYGMSSGEAPDRAEIIAAIRKAAISQGIDPDQAVRVATAESSLDVNAVGDRGTSFGIFQLHVGGGLGDSFRAIGREPSDPKTWKDQIDFAMAAARSEGWTPWHAWHGDPWAGIHPKEGVKAGPPPGKQSSVTIDTINVTSSKADPKAVADEIPDAMKRYSMLGGINTGLV